MKTSSPGLDSWVLSDLRWLPDELLEQLAEQMNVWEKTEWPAKLRLATCSLIPKTEGVVPPSEMRPISVAPTLYRLWATARLVPLKEWQDR